MNIIYLKKNESEAKFGGKVEKFKTEDISSYLEKKKFSGPVPITVILGKEFYYAVAEGADGKKRWTAGRRTGSRANVFSATKYVHENNEALKIEFEIRKSAFETLKKSKKYIRVSKIFPDFLYFLSGEENVFDFFEKKKISGIYDLNLSFLEKIRYRWKALAIVGGCILIIAGAGAIFSFGLKDRPVLSCANEMLPKEYIQPEAVTANNNRLPISEIDFISKFLSHGSISVCQLYEITQKDSWSQTLLGDLSTYGLYIKRKYEVFNGKVQSNIQKIKELEKSAGVLMTSEEERMIAYIAALNEFGIRVIAPASYTYTDPATPSKFNFVAKELGFGDFILSNIVFFYSFDGKQTVTDTSEVLAWNTPYNYLNTAYAPKFKGYGMSVKVVPKDEAQGQEQQQAQTQNNNAQEAQAPQNTAKETGSSSPTPITNGKTYTVSPTPADTGELGISAVEGNSVDISQATPQKSAEKKVEIPAPEKPEYTPKKILTPFQKDKIRNGEKSNDSSIKNSRQGKEKQSEN